MIYDFSDKLLHYSAVHYNFMEDANVLSSAWCLVTAIVCAVLFCVSFILNLQILVNFYEKSRKEGAVVE